MRTCSEHTAQVAADSGTSGVFENVGGGLYAVSFSVKSDTNGILGLRGIVAQQWAGTNLFERGVRSTGLKRDGPFS